MWVSPSFAEVTLRLTVSQYRAPYGTCDQILFPVGMLLSAKETLVWAVPLQPYHGVTAGIFFIYFFFTIYSSYLKRVISKRDGCEYLKQVPSIDGSLELI
jgi:hypothetical protein